MGFTFVFGLIEDIRQHFAIWKTYGPANFFDLPPELRNDIYNLVIREAHPAPWVFDPPYIAMHDPFFWKQIILQTQNIMRVNRQMREEARSLLYQTYFPKHVCTHLEVQNLLQLSKLAERIPKERWPPHSKVLIYLKSKRKGDQQSNNIHHVLNTLFNAPKNGRQTQYNGSKLTPLNVLLKNFRTPNHYHGWFKPREREYRCKDFVVTYEPGSHQRLHLVILDLNGVPSLERLAKTEMDSTGWWLGLLNRLLHLMRW